MECPAEVIRYCEENWEDLQPLHAPAQIKNDSLELNNVWACWYDENQNFHALDYTDDVLRVYVFPKAYPVAQQIQEVLGNGISIQEMDIRCETGSLK